MPGFALHPDRCLRCAVNGDDFTTCGLKDQLGWFKEQLGKQNELTEGARFGPGKDDVKEGRVLNRVVRWTPDGLEYEADPRQAEKFITECGLDGANTVVTPGVKANREELAKETELDDSQHTLYRASAARGNYLAAAY